MGRGVVRAGGSALAVLGWWRRVLVRHDVDHRRVGQLRLYDVMRLRLLAHVWLGAFVAPVDWGLDVTAHVHVAVGVLRRVPRHVVIVVQQVTHVGMLVGVRFGRR